MNTHLITKQQLIQRHQLERNKIEALCLPLEIEDYVIQSIQDVSPPKWHLAHTTWFFETFILIPHLAGYRPFHPSYQYLFNSYYQSFGQPFPRIQRGLLSRPTVKTIYEYRKYVDKFIEQYIEQQTEESLSKLQALLTLGWNHEQQHQELLLMDIKYNFSLDPNFPVYMEREIKHTPHAVPNTQFIEAPGGLIEIGHSGSAFCFDNELPRHTQFIKPFQIADALVTNGEYAEFIAAGGYQQAKWWLADGFDCIEKNQWHAPLYWKRYDNKWHVFTLSGLRECDPNEPVAHVSYYEADAYARWRGARLPTEGEWEHIVRSHNIIPQASNFLEANIFHPQPKESKKNSAQFFGDVWEWTTSAYVAYPGFKPLPEALGEYNGKFMSNQLVLRGGCCVTPHAHIRPSYRNFFQPDKRWQFSGIRLAKDLGE